MMSESDGMMGCHDRVAKQNARAVGCQRARSGTRRVSERRCLPFGAALRPSICLYGPPCYGTYDRTYRF